MKSERKKRIFKSQRDHAHECRLKVGSNQRSKGKEALRLAYTHTFRQHY